MKTVFITGIGGYLGSTIASLLAGEYRIVGYGHARNFALLRRRFGKNIKLVAGDITDEKALRRAVRGADAVVHTASPTKESFFLEFPCDAWKATVRGTRLVKEAAEGSGVPLFVHISSQAVYSNFRKRPMPLREIDALLPDTLYGAAKAESEWEAARAGKVNVVILRPSNIYGVGSGILRDNVIHAFAAAAREGKPLMLRNAGQRIDFVHVRDVVAAIKQALVAKQPKHGSPVIMNIGAGSAVAVEDAASIIVKEACALLGKKPKIVMKSVPGKKIPVDRWLSIKKAYTMLGWKPSVPLESGIKELLALK